VVKKKTRRHALGTGAATGNRLKNGDSEINESTRAVGPFSITTFFCVNVSTQTITIDLSKDTVRMAARGPSSRSTATLRVA
jgi:hypothetical protein